MDPYDFTIKAVRKAGKLLLQLRTEQFTTEEKGGDPRDIVTSVDRAVSEFLITEIKETFFNDHIYSEELGGSAPEVPRLWAIDPIDGSSNFSRDIPHFSICLALLEHGIPTIGAVYNPVTDELFSFKKGRGAFLNGVPIRVSAITDLKDASVFLHAGRKPEFWEWGGASYTKLLEAAKKTSNFGGSALDACFVAAGRIEANVYGQLTTMDIAAAIGILLEAGGRVVNDKGEPAGFSTTPQRVVMSNSPETEAALRKLLFM